MGLTSLCLPSLMKAASSLLVKKTLESAYKKFQSICSTRESNSEVQEYLANLEQLIKIRTFLSHEAVSLSDIYFPLRIKSPDSEYRLTDDGVIFVFDELQLLIGDIGQGKTTALKKTLQVAADSPNYIPFFISLKEFKNSTDFFDFLSIQLERFGVKFKNFQGLFTFLNNEKIFIILDGFDEIQTSKIESAKNGIERLTHNYSCKVVVSTRPDTLITKSDYCYKFYVLPINDEEKFGIIDNYIKKAPTYVDGSKLKSKIGKVKYINELLSSPLLVSLVFIVASQNSTFPRTEIEFYSSIFNSLFSRHDKLKGGIKREVKSNISCHNAQRIFETLCKNSFFNEVVEFDEFQLCEYITQASKGSDIEIRNPDDYLEDLKSIANLIVEIGFNKLSFTHRSIQEFYAYKYLLDKNKLREFYQKLLSAEYDPLWYNQIIVFALKNNHKSLCTTYYFQPIYKHLFDHDFDDKAKLSQSVSFSSALIYLKNYYYCFSYGAISEKVEVTKTHTDARIKLLAFADDKNKVELSNGTIDRDSVSFKNKNLGNPFIKLSVKFESAIIETIGIPPEEKLLAQTTVSFSKTKKYEVSVAELILMHCGFNKTYMLSKSDFEFPKTETISSIKNLLILAEKELTMSRKLLAKQLSKVHSNSNA